MQKEVRQPVGGEAGRLRNRAKGGPYHARAHPGTVAPASAPAVLQSDPGQTRGACSSRPQTQLLPAGSRPLWTCPSPPAVCGCLAPGSCPTCPHTLPPAGESTACPDTGPTLNRGCQGEPRGPPEGDPHSPADSGAASVKRRPRVLGWEEPSGQRSSCRASGARGQWDMACCPPSGSGASAPGSTRTRADKSLAPSSGGPRGAQVSPFAH